MDLKGSTLCFLGEGDVKARRKMYYYLWENVSIFSRLPKSRRLRKSLVKKDRPARPGNSGWYMRVAWSVCVLPCPECSFTGVMWIPRIFKIFGIYSGHMTLNQKTSEVVQGILDEKRLALRLRLISLVYTKCDFREMCSS